MKCNKCGFEIVTVFGRFCPKCGKPLSSVGNDAVSSPSIASTALSPKKDVRRGPVGIWGWNTIPILSLLYMAFSGFALAIAVYFSFISTGGIWDALIQTSDAYDPRLAGSIALVSVCNLIMGTLSVYALILASRRSVSYPRLAIGSFALFIGAEVADLLVANCRGFVIGGGDMLRMIRMVAVVAILVCYLKQSERIKNTFVNAPGNWLGVIGRTLAVALVVCWLGMERTKPSLFVVPHEKVQLWEGGPYWATTNIGAENPEDFGYYFWWGDTVGYKRENGCWVASNGPLPNLSFDAGNTPTYDKSIVTLRYEGWITADGALVPTKDAAHMHWGGFWRMPTKQEFDDLSSKCDWTWSKSNGVNGYIVRGRGEFVSNSIFMPCSGYGDGASLKDAGWRGDFWSSVPSSDSRNHSCGLYLNPGYHSTNYYSRYYRQPIRPVVGSDEVKEW